MTARPNIVEVVNAIAALKIPGVEICNLDNIPAAIQPARCPILSPKTDDLITDMEFERQTFKNAVQKVGYTINWNFYFSPMQSSAKLFSKYSDMVCSVLDVIDALGQLSRPLSGQNTEMIVSRMLQFGYVLDLDGTIFHGAVISVRVTEFLNPNET